MLYRNFIVFLLIFMALMSGNSDARVKKSRKKKRVHKVLPFLPSAPALEQADSPELAGFFQKLARLKDGSGKESVLIIGDSHNQCEDFGQALLEYLRDSAGIPVSGRNFAFPYPLARTGHRSPLQYSCNKKEWKGCRITNAASSCSWGISGWLARCSADSVSFSLKSGGKDLRAGDRLGIFSPQSSARAYNLYSNGKAGMKEIPYLDSLSSYVTDLSEDAESLHFVAVRKDSSGEFCHQGFTRSPAAEGLSIGITGTNGARIDHYLLSPDFEKQLQVLKPGLVMIALGTNDAFTPDFSPEKTKEYLGMLLARIRMVLPELPVLLIGPPDHCRKRGRFNPNTEKVNQLYAEMAEHLELGFWNQQTAMGGPGSIMAWRKKGLATPDLVHFFPGGYALQARLLGRSLRQQIEPFLRQPGKQEAAE